MGSLVGCVIDFFYNGGHVGSHELCVMTEDRNHISGYDIDSRMYKTFCRDLMQDITTLFRPHQTPQHTNFLPNSLEVYQDGVKVAEFKGQIDVNVGGYRLVVK
jgi:hypothetical protein